MLGSATGVDRGKNRRHHTARAILIGALFGIGIQPFVATASVEAQSLAAACDWLAEPDFGAEIRDEIRNDPSDEARNEENGERQHESDDSSEPSDSNAQGHLQLILSPSSEPSREHPRPGALEAALERCIRGSSDVSVTIDSETMHLVRRNNTWPDGFWSSTAHIFAPIHESRLSLPLDAELRSYVFPRASWSEATITTSHRVLPARLGSRVLGAIETNAGNLWIATSEGVVALEIEAAERPRFSGALLRWGDFPEHVASPANTFARTLTRPVAQFAELPGGELIVRVGRSASYAIEKRGDNVEASIVEHHCGSLFPNGDLCIRFAAGRDYFDSRMENASGETIRAPTSFYRRAVNTVLRTDGAESEVEVVTGVAGRLVARTETGDTSRVVGDMGYGSSLAARDVDEDGQLEVLSSSSWEAGPRNEELEDESIVLLRVAEPGGLFFLWRSPPLEGQVFEAVTAGNRFIAFEERNERIHVWVVSAPQTRGANHE